MIINFVEKPSERGATCEKILRTLPEWFGIPIRDEIQMQYIGG